MSREQPKALIEPAPLMEATADPVKRLVITIRKNLPAVSLDEYKSLSPGQQALMDASIYLEFHRLDQAAIICAEALGDPRTPGDAWIRSLIKAIALAQRLHDTTNLAFKERQAVLRAQRDDELCRREAAMANLTLLRLVSRMTL